MIIMHLGICMHVCMYVYVWNYLYITAISENNDEFESKQGRIYGRV